MAFRGVVRELVAVIRRPNRFQSGVICSAVAVNRAVERDIDDWRR